MLKSLLAGLSFLAVTAPAAAHEIWIERDATGPARIYFGEPALAVVAADEPNATALKQPLLFQTDKGQPIATRAAVDHLAADVPAQGDVRLYDETAFDPWDDDGVKNAAIFHARAGRAETAAKLDFELVPAQANGDRFTVQFRGKTLPGADVTVIDPGKWQKTFKADEQGVVAIPNRGSGRYILVSNHEEETSRQIGGVTVAKLHHVTTLSYVVK